jgi:hypothetical protein
LPLNFRITLAALCLLTAAVAIPAAFHTPSPAMAATTTAPAYDKDGKMLPPTNYREWIYLTSGIGMSYDPQPAGMEDHSSFDNVFVNPEAYRSFLDTGTWPDKTVMVLEARAAQSNGSINQHGHFQAGGITDLEVHVKDEARFPGKWAFFSFDSASGNGTLFPQLKLLHLPYSPCRGRHNLCPVLSDAAPYCAEEGHTQRSVRQGRSHSRRRQIVTS